MRSRVTKCKYLPLKSFWIRILVANVDPDQEHWFEYIFLLVIPYSMEE
jgi:hypothetical protein